MEPPGTPNLKKSRKVGTPKNIEKTTLQKVGYWSILTSKVDYFFAPEKSSKSHKSEISSKWAPRPPK